MQGALPSLSPLFTEVPRRGQPVEKVDVGPVGGPKEARNKAKTLREQHIQPLNQGLKRARRSFSTRWGVLGSSAVLATLLHWALKLRWGASVENRSLSCGRNVSSGVQTKEVLVTAPNSSERSEQPAFSARLMAVESSRLKAAELALADPLKEETRKARLYLLGVSMVGIAIVWTGLVPQEITTLGITFGQADRRALLLILALVVVYFLTAFAVYLDFSHFRARGKDTLLRALCARSDDRVPTPTNHDDMRLLAPSPHFLKEPVPIPLRRRLFLYRAIFFAGCCGKPTRKNLKGLRRTPSRRGTLRAAMAKVEIRGCLKRVDMGGQESSRYCLVGRPYD
jgi:hypothetical protein